MREIRWGIIGCGDVTEVKSGPGFQKASGSSLVAVMRRQPGLARDYAARHGVPKWYSDSSRLINDPEVDAVYIATPPGSHLELALAACAARKPVLVEKPMARSASECRTMVKAFQDHGIPLFVAYYRRALPRFLKAREILSSGAIGRIVDIRYSLSQPRHLDEFPAGLPWRIDASLAGGGHFFDLGCHTLDILDFLCGPLKDVQGRADQLGSACDVEDTVSMSFRTADGSPGSAFWTFCGGGGAEDVIRFSGTAGRLSLSTFGEEPLAWDRGGEISLIEVPQPAHVHQPLIQSIVNELLGGEPCASTGTSALRTAVVMDRVVENYYGNRDEGFWDRPETWPGRPRR